MSLINIVKTDDPNFRYKMPRISTKIEGRGNGIKTVITNMSEVAQALHRHPKYTTKFFGCELGAQTKYDDETDRSVVNGAHDNRTIQDLLFKFIELFVLCPNCNLPETALKARRGVIYHKCNACGEKSSVDMSHKLCTLILREEEKDKGKKKKKREDGSKKKDKKKKKKPQSEEKVEDWDPEITDEMRAADAEQEAILDTIDKTQGSDASEDEDVPTSDNVFVDDEEAINMASARVRSFVAEENRSPEEILELISTQQRNCGLSVDDKLKVAFYGLFSENIVEEICQHAQVFKKLMTSEEAQQSLLSLIECFVILKEPQVLRSMPVILKNFYDGDLLEEEIVLSWYKTKELDQRHPSINQEHLDTVYSCAQPFVDWIENAEEEEDE